MHGGTETGAGNVEEYMRLAYWGQGNKKKKKDKKIK